MALPVLDNAGIVTAQHVLAIVQEARCPDGRFVRLPCITAIKSGQANVFVHASCNSLIQLYTKCHCS